MPENDIRIRKHFSTTDQDKFEKLEKGDFFSAFLNTNRVKERPRFYIVTRRRTEDEIEVFEMHVYSIEYILCGSKAPSQKYRLENFFNIETISTDPLL